MYSAKKGIPNDWHFTFKYICKSWGWGLIDKHNPEATAVQKIGRITPYCCGLWTLYQFKEFQKIAKFVDKKDLSQQFN